MPRIANCKHDGCPFFMDEQAAGTTVADRWRAHDMRAHRRPKIFMVPHISADDAHKDPSNAIKMTFSGATRAEMLEKVLAFADEVRARETQTPGKTGES